MQKHRDRKADDCCKKGKLMRVRFPIRAFSKPFVQKFLNAFFEFQRKLPPSCFFPIYLLSISVSWSSLRILSVFSHFNRMRISSAIASSLGTSIQILLVPILFTSHLSLDLSTELRKRWAAFTDLLHSSLHSICNGGFARIFLAVFAGNNAELKYKERNGAKMGKKKRHGIKPCLLI